MSDDKNVSNNEPKKPSSEPSRPAERPQKPSPDVVRDIPRQTDDYGEKVSIARMSVFRASLLPPRNGFTPQIAISGLPPPPGHPCCGDTSPWS